MKKKQPAWQRFVPNTPLHVYKRTIDSGVIFYDEILILEHFLLLCHYARMYKVKLLSLTYMLTHYHALGKAKLQHDLQMCFSSANETFSKRVNAFWQHKGGIFEKGIAFALKSSFKAIRSSLNYIANNGPEKKLSLTAINYKWNFLRYALSPNPYSEPIIKSEVSKDLMLAIEQMRYLRRHNQVPSLAFLLTFRSKLSRKEWLQFFDATIAENSEIDFSEAASYFGDLNNMISAPDTNSGAEYDLQENDGTNSYVPLREMCSVVYKKDSIFNPYDKNMLQHNAQMLFTGTRASFQEIARFLHIEEDDLNLMLVV